MLENTWQALKRSRSNLAFFWFFETGFYSNSNFELENLNSNEAVSIGVKQYWPFNLNWTRALQQIVNVNVMLYTHNRASTEILILAQLDRTSVCVTFQRKISHLSFSSFSLLVRNQVLNHKESGERAEEIITDANLTRIWNDEPIKSIFWRGTTSG